MVGETEIRKAFSLSLNGTTVEPGCIYGGPDEAPHLDLVQEEPGKEIFWIKNGGVYVAALLNDASIGQDIEVRKLGSNIVMRQAAPFYRLRPDHRGGWICLAKPRLGQGDRPRYLGPG